MENLKEQKVRLQKYLAECGVASRRKCEELILGGYVKINGHPAEIGCSVTPNKDIITVHGKKVEQAHRMRYVMLYKPRGYVTTLSDEQNRRCVADLLKGIPERVFPVGRLDRDSEGLLLITNDGNFANAMSHPSTHVSKTYRVTVRPGVAEEQLQQMRDGMIIEGQKTAPAEATLLLEDKDRAVFEIVLYEGRNREIRKMCEALSLEVARLKRVAVGTVRIGMLAPGKWRELTEQEIRALLSQASRPAKKADDAQQKTGEPKTRTQREFKPRSGGKNGERRGQNGQHPSVRRSR